MNWTFHNGMDVPEYERLDVRDGALLNGCLTLCACYRRDVGD